MQAAARCDHTPRSMQLVLQPSTVGENGEQSPIFSALAYRLLIRNLVPMKAALFHGYVNLHYDSTAATAARTVMVVRRESRRLFRKPFLYLSKPNFLSAERNLSFWDH
jgi:hypothetical protein